jgi:DNA-binding TFAR19-related protein (PDSD5 family)
MILERKVKQHLSKEAISRFGNVKIAYPELALKVIMVLAQAIESGQLKETINDEGLKSLLMEMQRQ